METEKTTKPESDQNMLKRCHCCHETKALEHFYVLKKSGRINTFKCKKCYKEEYRKIMRENVLV